MTASRRIGHLPAVSVVCTRGLEPRTCGSRVLVRRCSLEARAKCGTASSGTRHSMVPKTGCSGLMYPSFPSSHSFTGWEGVDTLIGSDIAITQAGGDSD